MPVMVTAYRNPFEASASICRRGAGVAGVDELLHVTDVERSRRDGGEDLVDDPSFQLWVEDGEGDLDAPPEVAGHPVGAGDKDAFITAVVEVEDAAVFEDEGPGTNRLPALHRRRVAQQQHVNDTPYSIDRHPNWASDAPSCLT